jgi:hypothetical protein
MDTDGVNHYKRAFDITDDLIRRSYSDADIELILGGNFPQSPGTNLDCFKAHRRQAGTGNYQQSLLDCLMPFQLESNYKPRGDQAQAIAKLIKAVEAGNRHQTLMGVTGSGKTFTVANVIRSWIDLPSSFRTIKPWPRSFTPNSSNSSRGMLSSISSVISIITSLRLISPAPTPTLRKIPPSTKRSSGCDLRRQARCFRAETPLW